MKRSFRSLLACFLLFSFAAEARVILPKGGEEWSVGSSVLLQWDASDSPVEIHLIRPDQDPIVIAEGLANTDHYLWPIEELEAARDYRIEIKPSGGNAVQSRAFRIVAWDERQYLGAFEETDRSKVTHPLKAAVLDKDKDNRAVTVDWVDYRHFLRDNVRIFLYQVGNVRQLALKTKLDNTGRYDWELNDPSIEACSEGACYFVVRSGRKRGQFITSHPFTLGANADARAYTVSSAAQEGSDLAISWQDSTDAPSEVRLDLVKDGAFYESVSESRSSPGDANTLSWPIPSTVRAGEYTLLLTKLADGTQRASSEPFVIETPEDAVKVAIKRKISTTTQTTLVIWANNRETVDIDLYRDGKWVKAIARDGSVASLRNWKLPRIFTEGDGYTVRVSQADNPEIFGFSDPFSISASGATVAEAPSDKRCQKAGLDTGCTAEALKEATACLALGLVGNCTKEDKNMLEFLRDSENLVAQCEACPRGTVPNKQRDKCIPNLCAEGQSWDFVAGRCRNSAKSTDRWVQMMFWDVNDDNKVIDAATQRSLHGLYGYLAKLVGEVDSVAGVQDVELVRNATIHSCVNGVPKPRSGEYSWKRPYAFHELGTGRWLLPYYQNLPFERFNFDFDTITSDGWLGGIKASCGKREDTQRYEYSDPLCLKPYYINKSAQWFKDKRCRHAGLNPGCSLREIYDVRVCQPAGLDRGCTRNEAVSATSEKWVDDKEDKYVFSEESVTGHESAVDDFRFPFNVENYRQRAFPKVPPNLFKQLYALNATGELVSKYDGAPDGAEASVARCDSLKIGPGDTQLDWQEGEVFTHDGDGERNAKYLPALLKRAVASRNQARNEKGRVEKAVMALNISAHGTGYTVASMDLAEVRSAILEEVGVLDVLSFDACLMGNYESLVMMKDVTKWFVGATDSIGVDGDLELNNPEAFQKLILNAITAKNDKTKALTTKGYVKNVVKWLASSDSSGYGTFNVYDMAKFPAFQQSFDDVLALLANDMPRYFRTLVPLFESHGLEGLTADDWKGGWTRGKGPDRFGIDTFLATLAQVNDADLRNRVQSAQEALSNLMPVKRLSANLAFNWDRGPEYEGRLFSDDWNELIALRSFNLAWAEAYDAHNRILAGEAENSDFLLVGIDVVVVTGYAVRESVKAASYEGEFESIFKQLESSHPEVSLRGVHVAIKYPENKELKSDLLPVIAEQEPQSSDPSPLTESEIQRTYFLPTGDVRLSDGTQWSAVPSKDKNYYSVCFSKDHDNQIGLSGWVVGAPGTDEPRKVATLRQKADDESTLDQARRDSGESDSSIYLDDILCRNLSTVGSQLKRIGNSAYVKPESASCSGMSINSPSKLTELVRNARKQLAKRSSVSVADSDSSSDAIELGADNMGIEQVYSLAKVNGELVCDGSDPTKFDWKKCRNVTWDKRNGLDPGTNPVCRSRWIEPGSGKNPWVVGRPEGRSFISPSSGVQYVEPNEKNWYDCRIACAQTEAAGWCATDNWHTKSGARSTTCNLKLAGYYLDGRAKLRRRDEEKVRTLESLAGDQWGGYVWPMERYQVHFGLEWTSPYSHWCERTPEHIQRCDRATNQARAQSNLNPGGDGIGHSDFPKAKRRIVDALSSAYEYEANVGWFGPNVGEKEMAIVRTRPVFDGLSSHPEVVNACKPCYRISTEDGEITGCEPPPIKQHGDWTGNACYDDDPYCLPTKTPLAE